MKSEITRPHARAARASEFDNIEKGALPSGCCRNRYAAGTPLDMGHLRSITRKNPERPEGFTSEGCAAPGTSFQGPVGVGAN